MEHISLYRKWRPQTFTEVVGQARVTNTLANALESGRVVHAYLFAGPRGTGKTSTARILAKAINCVEGPTATPCGVCDACVSISEGTAMDVIEIDAASNRKIDEIRDLLDKIPYMPTALRTKVYIIDEVHQLTNEASSALLKTLEEPPSHIVFVLATTEPHKLLPTIVSRCQKFDFSLVSAQDMCRLLEHIATREGIQVEGEAVAMIAEHAHGSVRDAIGVMDQIANLSGELITQEQLADMLGEVETDLVFEMVDLIADRDTPGTLTCVGNLVEDGKEPRQFVEALIGHLRSLFLVQNAANPSEIVEATDEHFARLADQAGRLKRHEVVRLMERLGEAHREMRWSESPRLVLECALVKITSLDADATLEGLAFRIDELERKLASLGGADVKNAVAAPDSRQAIGSPAPTKAPSPPAGKVSAREAKKKPAPEENPVEKVVAAAEAPATPPARTDEASAGERERDRRAWMAVLAELKKTGQMKLWTLLAKARVASSGNGELVLGFSEECAFQMEALTGSPGLETVAELWERFVGQPVTVKLTLAAARPPRAEEPPPAAKPSVEATAEDPVVEEPDLAPEMEEPVSAGGDVEESESVEPAGKKSSAEIARIFKERFDGEIIDKTKEGKE